MSTARPPSVVTRQLTDKRYLGFVDDRGAAQSRPADAKGVAGACAAIVPDRQVADPPIVAALAELPRLEPLPLLVGNSG